MSATFNRQSLKVKLMGLLAKTGILVTICVFFVGFSLMAKAQTVEDSASVYKFVQEYQRTFNTRDTAALSEFFTEDADVLVGNLLKARGRQAIENLWRNYWRSKFNRQEPGRRGTFKINSLRKITDDVALINLLSVTGGQDSLGAELRTRKARGTWVVHRLKDEWLIASIFMLPAETDSVILRTSV